MILIIQIYANTIMYTIFHNEQKEIKHATS
jgi:hypothetical protein